MPLLISVLISVLTSVLAWACGFALAGILPQVSGGGALSWPSWSRSALAQDVGAEPSEWQRLAGPLPYRPEELDSGWLTETDLTRAVDLIADLGLFFAKLSEADPDSRAREVWGLSDAAHGAAADDLRAEIQAGQFRIVISKGSSLAITRRGEEIWVDSDLAGAWNVEQVRRARSQGDDWSDIAVLSGLLFDLWRGLETTAGDAWLDHQLKSMAVSKTEFEKGGTGAAAVLTRYGFLKDLFHKASLLRAATANSADAALWRNRAQRIQQQIDTLLRSVATTGLSGELATGLRDDWAEYRAEIEQSSAERTRLVLAARQPAPTLSRIGTVARKPEQDPRPGVAQEAAAGNTAPDAETEVPQAQAVGGTQARDQDYIALLLARTADAARAAEEAEKQADTMARQAGAAILAAEQARNALAATQTGTESAAEEAAVLRRRVEDLAAELDQARGNEAALQAQLAEAQDQVGAADTTAAEARVAREAAERQATDLGALLTAARSGAESAAEEAARLRRRVEDLAAELDQARGNEAALQAQLAEAQDRASAADSAAAKFSAEATGRNAELEGQLAARDADLTRAEAQAASQAVASAKAGVEIGRLENQIETLRAVVADADADGAALAAAESGRAALETKLQELQAELAAERSRAETAAEETAGALDQEQARAAGLGATLAESQQALAAAQDQTQSEAARAAQAEAAAARANQTAEEARRKLASSQEELGSLRADIRALRQERATSAAQAGEAPSPLSRVPTWLEGWRGPIMAAVILAGGLVVLLAVLRRRAPVRQPSLGASETVPAAAPEARPAPAAMPTDATDARQPVKETPAAQPAAQPGAPPGGARHFQAAPVTSATIVEAVRRQDWATAETQFAQLSGVSAPRLKELLGDPSGELLALACRAAGLDRLTFAALYLLQGQGRAVADPKIVAGAIGLFEKTGPAEAQRLLAERRVGDSLSA
jgi:hypothetical protein